MVVEVEAPDSPEVVEALVGEFVAGMAALACRVIAEEQAVHLDVGARPIL